MRVQPGDRNAQGAFLIPHSQPCSALLLSLLAARGTRKDSNHDALQCRQGLALAFISIVKVRITQSTLIY